MHTANASDISSMGMSGNKQYIPSTGNISIMDANASIDIETEITKLLCIIWLSGIGTPSIYHFHVRQKPHTAKLDDICKVKAVKLFSHVRVKNISHMGLI